MSTPRRLRVGVLGAGAWASFAHLPGFTRDPRCEVVAIADPQRDLAEAAAERFGIPAVFTDHQSLIGRDDIDVIDVCTPSATHFELAWAALEAGKHVLCEKPVAYDFRDTRRARGAGRVARASRPSSGFTFRYAPAMRYMRELIDAGLHRRRRSSSTATSRTRSGSIRRRRCARSITTPISRCCRSRRSRATARRSSTSRTCWSAATSSSVVGTMRNFIPERMVRATGRMMRMNIDDGDIFIGEFANGALCSIQTSFVTVGNYPGIEARLYGSEGRAHLPAGRGGRHLRDAEGGHARTRSSSASCEVPARFYPAGRRRARNRGARCSTPTSSPASSPRSWTAAPPTKATSRMAPGCRK